MGLELGSFRTVFCPLFVPFMQGRVDAPWPQVTAGSKHWNCSRRWITCGCSLLHMHTE